MDFWRAVSQQLEDWQKGGLSQMPHLDVELRGNITPAPAVSRPAPITPVQAQPPIQPQPALPPATQEIMPRKKEPSMPVISTGKIPCAERIKLLDQVQSKVSVCTRCPHLATTRNKTVFGTGDPEAQIMFIGEAPGADEDEQGIPFVGRAGQLLDKIIAACGFKREDIYICNILHCRPPGNRAPLPDEAANCREYLDAQIKIVNPKWIICWGATAAQNLLQSKDAIGKMRKKFFDYHNAKVTCTYHPSYLLRNPPMKKEVWEDMKFFLQEIGIDPETVPGSQKPAT